MISAKYKNICVVGDNDQSIYSFRGANYNNILNFEKDYSNTKVVLLEENYRSTKTILRAANDVIKNNRLRKEKNLWTSNEDGAKIRYYRAYDEKDEAAYVTSHIKKIHDEGIPYDEIAVLYRTNAQSRVMEEYFMMDNIPYKVVGAFAFYNRKEIKDLVAYLKLIYNEKDNVNLLRCINVPRRGIGPKTLENLQIKADSGDKSIYEVIDSGKELNFKKTIEDFKEKAKNSSLTELVEYVINNSGMGQELISEKSIEADIRLENLEEFKSITRGFEERSGVVSLEEFLMQISLVSNSEDVKEEYDKVSLMTMHAAKGLEFDVVFAVGIEEGIMPHSGIDTSESDIEEERRLFYVTITRAKKYLYLLNARMRMLFGDRSIRGESTFIKEINEKKHLSVPIGISNRHVHVSRKDLDVLFGDGYGLSKYRDLKQPGQYASNELVTIKGPNGEFPNVRILGPVRDETQVEISVTDGFKLGIKPPVRESGKLKNSAGIEIIGPSGRINKSEGCIAALRHIHMDQKIAEKLNLKDKDIVDVKVPGVRNAILGNVIVRVSDEFELEMHIDVDEANACSLKNNDTVRIIKKGQSFGFN
jgi:propanediol utilization protein